MTAVPHVTEPAYLTRRGVTRLTYPELTTANVEHGIAVFKDLDTGPPGPDSAQALAGALRGSLDPAPGCLVIPVQKHTSVVRRVQRPDCGGRPVACDGLVTRETGVMIAVSVADCIPLFALDRPGGVVGVAHCGWRGIASGIVEEFLACLKGLARRKEDVVYLVGASIGSCCYSVREDFLGHFSSEEVGSFSTESGDRTCFDLKTLVASRLVRSGVGAGQISIDNTCTSCNKYLLSSYRADGGKCGRMLAFLMVRE
ncbi:MAG: polyphenol oxidase family protein [Candidatus Eisenbacteria bacterium]